MNRRTVLSLLLALCTALPLAAQADTYPTKSVRFIVSYPPGGANDVIARYLALELGKALKQSVYVDNRPGAGAALGTQALANAAPDGYTIGLTGATSLITGPLLYRSTKYKREDFAQVIMIGSFPNAFTVRADNPAKTMQDLIARAKASPEPINYGSAGLGSIGHLTGELMAQMTGAKLLHIPYKGTAQATIDLLGGRIEGMFDGLPTAMQQAKAGEVRILAVTGTQRDSTMPDVPTLEEAMPGLFGVAWFSVAVPAKTPEPIIARLRDELAKMLAAPETKKQLIELGMTPSVMSGQPFADFVQAETKKWGQVIKTANVKVE